MLALQEIRRKKLQFGLITLIVGLVVYLLVMIGALGSGLMSAMSGAVDSFNADLVVFSADSNNSFLRSELTADQQGAISGLLGPDKTGAVGYMVATAQRAVGSEEVALFAFQPGSIAEPAVRSGRPIEGQDEILIDKSLSRSSGLRLGDVVVMRSALKDYEFTVVGEVEGGQFLGLPAAWVGIDQWREMRYPGQGKDAPAASVLLIRDGGSDTRGRVEEVVGNTSVVTKSAAINSIGGVKQQQQVVMTIELFGFVIGALVIGSFFFVLTMQRSYEIAIFKAMGASNWWVFGQLIRQVTVIALAGIALGIPLAVLTAAAIPSDVPLEVTAGAFLTGAISITVAALLGAVFSARQVVRVNPISALGQM
jgi:putative ABC transport system permease protein